MKDSWDEMRRAKEEDYFHKQNEAAVKRLKERVSVTPRNCPLNNKPMKQVTHLGVNIDVCEECGGVWLDKGELEALMNASKSEKVPEGGVLASVIKNIFG